jgi:hypothetical protein
MWSFLTVGATFWLKGAFFEHDFWGGRWYRSLLGSQASKEFDRYPTLQLLFNT